MTALHWTVTDCYVQQLQHQHSEAVQSNLILVSGLLALCDICRSDNTDMQVLCLALAQYCFECLRVKLYNK